MPNQLRRYDPLNAVSRFEPLRAFDNLFDAFGMMPQLRQFEEEGRIRMDVTETDQAYLIKAEMPGIKKEDVKVSIEGDQVTISAEVNKDDERRDGNVVCRERYQGRQFRSFTLPQDVDDSQATATCNNGVLELTLPKKPGGGAKQLTIQ